MKRLSLILLLALPLHAQLWSGILKPTYGAGACTLAATQTPAGCGIDWTQVGVPGGVPSSGWTQSGSTIAAVSCSNGASDCTATIQAALNACSGNKYVLLGAGTYKIATAVIVPSNCELRGAGANQTIINATGTTSNAPIALGENASDGVRYANRVSITAGASAGATSITLASGAGISAGMYLAIAETNAAYVFYQGGEGNCTWCDGWWDTSTGTTARGQIVEVQSVSGNTVTFAPALYTGYTNTPFAIPFTAAAKYAGVRDLQVYANDSGYAAMVQMGMCAYCWVKGIEVNYTDGDYVNDSYGFRDEIRDSYFTNSFIHSPGSSDGEVNLARRTTATLVENNIIERTHLGIILEWGVAGNVLGYNYNLSDYDDSVTNFTEPGIDMHGAHPQFNLLEGNVLPTYTPDETWGSSSHNTNLRNWTQGTDKVCTTTAGRVTVSCSSSHYTFQSQEAENIGHYSWYDNFIGDVMGSAAQQSTVGTHVGILPYGGGTRSYDSVSYGMSIGFGGASDDGVSTDGCDGSTISPCHSVDAYKTSVIYKTYTLADGVTNCLSGGSSSTCSTAIPASFYLSSKPSWWPSGASWPAIGPDVTGGTGPGGHASLTASNAAQYCYTQIMGGSDGSPGTPLSFNANTCYGSVAPGSPVSLSGIVVGLVQ